MTNEIISAIPEMKIGNDLKEALTVLPEYNIKNGNAATRLIALSDLYKICIPSEMSIEIYSKLYLALLHSLQKKTLKETVMQYNENHKLIIGQNYNNVLGGSDSFTIIGKSGIGKSTAVNKAIELLSENGIIETREPYAKIIPCLVVQCPFDSSVKGLLLEILRKVDETINSNYYSKSLRARITTDMLIGSVSQVAINHIGLLVVDEIQNVVNSKNGKSLVGMLTQLINSSGISICMVGTPECELFFEQALHLARRSLGLYYEPLKYNDYFYDFCRSIYSYQYTQNETDISDSIIEWLYEHSGGIISVVVSLIHDAQEIAILNGKEILNIDTLNEAYKKRMSMLHDYISPQKHKLSGAIKKDIPLRYDEKETEETTNVNIPDLVIRAKTNNCNVVDFLKDYLTIEEIKI